MKYTYKKAIRKGIKEEKEHYNTYKMIKNYCKKKKPLNKTKFYKAIAKDHIKESGNKYYHELDKMERKLKRKRYK